MPNDHNAEFRFGSADFASYREIARAGMFRQKPDSLFVGFHDRKPLWYSGPGGVLLVAGARSGKLRDILAYNLLPGVCLHTIFALDPKGELAAISRNQTADRKYVITWNPFALHGLPAMRINPVGHLTADSPSLISDVKVLCENLIPPTGSPQGAYFEGRAREVLEGIIVTLVRLNGVLSLPDLYRITSLIPGAGDEWVDFAWEMTQSGYPFSARIEEELAAAREDSSGGFQGILGEVFKSVACLSDPALMQAVSPPFDFDLGEPCKGNQAYQVYFIVPAEFLSASSPVLRAMFVGAMAHKSKAPDAPMQSFILDECAQLAGDAGFPLITKLFTYGAGIGIRPIAVFQDIGQMNTISKGAETIIPSSAACRIYFGVRDIASATALSRMLGVQTLLYDDHAAQARARHAKTRAMQAMLSEDDPLGPALDMAHHRNEAFRQTKQQRLLRTPDEIINEDASLAYVFVDGLTHPVLATRRAYWTQRFTAGRYYPNPYHPPADTVRVTTRWGMRTRRVITEPVPERFAHYPQYQDGMWQRIGR